MSKICFKCLVKMPINKFYRHKKSADGHLNKCKECTKKDVHLYRDNNIEKIRKYDRKRALKDHRVLARKQNDEKWKKNPKLRKRKYMLQRIWIKNNRQKRFAHCLVSQAIKNKILLKKPCEVCAKKNVQAHHDNYNLPLAVRWLCSKHHSEFHRKERERLRKI